MSFFYYSSKMFIDSIYEICFLNINFMLYPLVELFCLYQFSIDYLDFHRYANITAIKSDNCFFTALPISVLWKHPPYSCLGPKLGVILDSFVFQTLYPAILQFCQLFFKNISRIWLLLISYQHFSLNYWNVLLAGLPAIPIAVLWSVFQMIANLIQFYCTY